MELYLGSQLLYYVHRHKQPHGIIRKSMEHIKMTIEIKGILIKDIENQTNRRKSSVFQDNSVSKGRYQRFFAKPSLLVVFGYSKASKESNRDGIRR